MIEYIKNDPEFHTELPSVLTIGKFDGLHMGHKKIMDEVSKAKEKGLSSVIFTFDIPPQEAIYHDSGKGKDLRKRRGGFFLRSALHQ